MKFIISSIVILSCVSSQCIADSKPKPKIPNLNIIKANTAGHLNSKARVNQRKTRVVNGYRVIDKKGRVIGATSKKQKCLYYGNVVNGKATINSGINVRKVVFKCR